MPAMSPEAMDAVAKHVQPKLKETACPVCKSSEWVVAGSIFELREFSGGSLVIGGNTSIIPLVAATCHVCGHTLFFNAIHVQAVKPLLRSKQEEK